VTILVRSHKITLIFLTIGFCLCYFSGAITLQSLVFVKLLLFVLVCISQLRKEPDTFESCRRVVRLNWLLHREVKISPERIRHFFIDFKALSFGEKLFLI